MWTGYQKNLDALATFDDVCAYGDSTQPQCAAAQALAPFRYIVSASTAVRYWQAGWLLHCRHTLSALDIALELGKFRSCLHLLLAAACWVLRTAALSEVKCSTCMGGSCIG